MNNDQHPSRDGSDLNPELELFVDRALGEIDAEASDWREPDDLELAAAEAALYYAELEAQPMPEAVRSKLRAIAQTSDWHTEQTAESSGTGHATARERIEHERRISPLPPPRARSASSPSVLGKVGWLAAAAAIAIAAVGWLRPTPTAPDGGQTVVSTSIEERLATLEGIPGTVSSDWFAWPAGTLAPETAHRPAADNVSGRFVWNESKQEGYMVFENMPVNDPKLEQYQLWLVSADHEHPIDGGVFNAATSERVIIPIDPKLRATNLAALGITVEKPGGVVVSSREDRMVAALVPQG